MNKNNYTPHPIDTKDVDLPQELKALAENVAKNVHEVWSAGRMKDGWTYGEERNDAERKHPCLVPYEELSEEEKEYDRNTSVETIKLILKLGFKYKGLTLIRLLQQKRDLGIKKTKSRFLFLFDRFWWLATSL